ncbi:MAG: hypothetical protein K2J00_07775 [Bacteroidaceae bacterium]|nr:hypothetical protein [Bacteroidaceae bacterium]
MSAFKINDDGTVTTIGSSSSMTEVEKQILDALRVEASKGGVFAPLRMKRRALKYANSYSASVQFPQLVVDRLMLEHYPKFFVIYRKSWWLCVWGAVIFAFMCITALAYINVYLIFERYWRTDYMDSGMYIILPFATFCLGVTILGAWRYMCISKQIVNSIGT